MLSQGNSRDLSMSITLLLAKTARNVKNYHYGAMYLNPKKLMFHLKSLWCMSLWRRAFWMCCCIFLLLMKTWSCCRGISCGHSLGDCQGSQDSKSGRCRIWHHLGSDLRILDALSHKTVGVPPTFLSSLIKPEYWKLLC